MDINQPQTINKRIRVSKRLPVSLHLFFICTSAPVPTATGRVATNVSPSALSARSRRRSTSSPPLARSACSSPPISSSFSSRACFACVSVEWSRYRRWWIRATLLTLRRHVNSGICRATPASAPAVPVSMAMLLRGGGQKVLVWNKIYKNLFLCVLCSVLDLHPTWIRIQDICGSGSTQVNIV